MSSLPTGTETDSASDAGRPSRLSDARYDEPRDLPVIAPENYTVKGEIARGGMGRILEATDRRLDRPVAIKQLLRSSARGERLFEREVRITARLQHPAIVSVYEAGRLTSGELFYAMKLVAGRALSKVIEATDTLDERLGILPSVVAVCDALAYAHENRIIHRDLKPSNVLVGDFGETVVIDWGLAKDLAENDSVSPSDSDDSDSDSDDSDSDSDGDDSDGDGDGSDAGGPEQTVSGLAIGTPSYMPPEQARGERVDERSDVYALGAMLYHVLTGAKPYSGSDARQIVAQVCDGPPPPIEELEPRVPRDLRTLIERAMSRDSAERYPSAVELAEDLRRFQTGQLVSSHRYSRGDLVRRWIKRHRAEVLVVGIALAVLSVLLVVGVKRIIRERDVASERANRLTLAQAQSSLDSDPEKAVHALRTLPPSARQWGAARILASDADQRGVGQTVTRHGAAASHVVAGAGDSIASASEDGAVALSQGGKTRLLWVHDGPVTALAFDPTGRWLASSSRDSRVRLHDQTSGTSRVLEGHKLPVTHIAFSKNGEHLASADSRGSVRRWLTATGIGREITSPISEIAALGFDDDDQLVTINGDGELAIWSRGDDPASRATSSGVSPVAAEFGARASRLATVDRLGVVRVRHRESQAVARLGQMVGAPTALRISPSGDRLIGASRGSPPRLWRLVDGAETLLPHPQTQEVAFLANGLVATGGRDGVIRVWNPNGTLARELRGHRAAISALVVNTAGDGLLSASADREIRRWHVLPISPRRLVGHTTWVSRVGFAGDRQVVSAGWDSTLRVWDLDSGGARTLRGHSGAIRDLTISRDGLTAVTGGDDRTVRVWDLASGSHRTLGSHQDTVAAVAISPDGAWIGSAGRDNVVRLWNAADGESRVLVGHTAPVVAIAFSADGAMLASASKDHTSRLWHLDGRSREIVKHADKVETVAFSADGHWMASAGFDRTIIVTSLRDGSRRRLEGHGAPVRDVEFSPDSRWLISASDDMTARLWNPRGGKGRRLAGHRDFVTRAHFDATSRTAITASEDGVVSVWDVATGTRRALAAGKWLGDVAVSPSGEHIAACGADDAVLVWRDDLPRDAPALRAWLATRATSPPVVRADVRAETAHE